MNMVAQPYPLWIVWDEPDKATRATYYAQVIGWREIWDGSRSTKVSPRTVMPVVIHPETMLPVTLGNDGPAPVSRMAVSEDRRTVSLWKTARQGVHMGLR